jgi:hypothetical protein
MSVPSEALNTHDSDISAKTAKPFNQTDINTCARSS